MLASKQDSSAQGRRNDTERGGGGGGADRFQRSLLPVIGICFL